ncbi:MAG: sugar ABC transporter substrate-binding protein [Clostridia bacterium]|nr:sugar ABC transporter substrate-binding protein [Clostridia bacterium]
MLKVKKMIAGLLILSLSAAISLTGCKSTPGSGEQVTITHYTLTDADKNYVKELVPDFEKANPGIKVKIQEVPYDQYDQKLQTMIAGGTPPDVTSHWGKAGFIEFYDKGQLLDLTPYLEGNKYNPTEAGIPENLLNIYKINGKQYGIPAHSYVSVMIYNKDMFDKAKIPYPPSDYEDKSWTFDKMLEVAKKLSNGSNNVSDATFGIDWAWGEPDMRPVYFGEKVFSDDAWTNGGHPTECYFDSPGVINAYQKLADMIWKDKVQPNESIRRGIAGQNGEAFISGKIGMAVAGAWLLASAGECKFNVGVAAIPYGGNPNVRNVLYVDPLFIFKGSKHPNEAFEWIKYLCSAEVQEKSLELSGGTPPANAKAAQKYYNSFKGIDPKDLENVVIGGTKYGVESYNHLITNYSQIWTIIDNETTPLLKSGKKTAAQVVPEMQKKLSELLEKTNSKYKK